MSCILLGYKLDILGLRIFSSVVSWKFIRFNIIFTVLKLSTCHHYMKFGFGRVILKALNICSRLHVSSKSNFEVSVKWTIDAFFISYDVILPVITFFHCHAPLFK